MTSPTLKAVMLLRKEYDGESIVDAARDVHEAFDAEFTPEAASIPCSGFGIYEGMFAVTVEWRPEGEEAKPALPADEVRRIAEALARLEAFATQERDSYGDYQTYDAVMQEVSAIREALEGK